MCSRVLECVLGFFECVLAFLECVLGFWNAF